MDVTKTSAFGSRFNMYHLKGSAYAYNPTTRLWEVFVTDADGVIQDLVNDFETKAQAKEKAQEIANETKE